MSKIIYPAYFQTVKRADNAWYFSHGRAFYRGASSLESLEDRELYYGLTKEKIVIELFRINGGKEGYYLANLRDRKYYYCGDALGDVRTMLQILGIGRADPLER